MRIGLTFDLREDYLALGWSDQEVAEFDREDTIVSLEDAVRAIGHTPVRIGGAAALMAALSRGERWDLVLNIAESTAGTGRESLVPALLDHAEIPYTGGDPLCCAVTLDKPTSKRVLRDCGLATPEFMVVSCVEEITEIDLVLPVFVKPSREGSSKGVDSRSVCRSLDQLREVCTRLLVEFSQPVLIESFLPGEEVTVGIVGEGPSAEVVGVLGVELQQGASVYGYNDKERCEELVQYRLIRSPFGARAAELALEAFRALGCRDAGRVDIRADLHGVPQIIEVNALPGLHPSHSDLPIMATLAGMTYADLIRRIVESAMRRAGASSTHRSAPTCGS